MNELDKISMMIITYAGTARSSSIMMIDAAERGEDVEPYIADIEENLKLAGQEHHKVLTLSAQQEVVPTILFIHAEDQMMASETLFIIAKKFAKLYKDKQG